MRRRAGERFPREMGGSGRIPPPLLIFNHPRPDQANHVFVIYCLLVTRGLRCLLLLNLLLLLLVFLLELLRLLLVPLLHLLRSRVTGFLLRQPLVLLLLFLLQVLSLLVLPLHQLLLLLLIFLVRPGIARVWRGRVLDRRKFLRMEHIVA